MAKKDEEYPWFKVTFLPNGFDVELNQFEKITPRLMARGMRQVSRQRRVKIKQLMREERLNAKGRRKEKPERERRPEKDAGTDADLNRLIDDAIGKSGEVHGGTEPDERVNKKSKGSGKGRRQKAKAKN